MEIGNPMSSTGAKISMNSVPNQKSNSFFNLTFFLLDLEFGNSELRDSEVRTVRKSDFASVKLRFES